MTLNPISPSPQLKRRELLRLLALGGGSAALAACGPRRPGGGDRAASAVESAGLTVRPRRTWIIPATHDSDDNLVTSP